MNYRKKLRRVALKHRGNDEARTVYDHLYDRRTEQLTIKIPAATMRKIEYYATKKKFTKTTAVLRFIVVCLAHDERLDQELIDRYTVDEVLQKNASIDSIIRTAMFSDFDEHSLFKPDFGSGRKKNK